MYSAAGSTCSSAARSGRDTTSSKPAGAIFLAISAISACVGGTTTIRGARLGAMMFLLRGERSCMHVAAGEEQLTLRRRGLAAAAADHDLAVGDHIGDAGQVTVADGVGDAGAGRALDRPADDQVRRAARRQDADGEAMSLGGVAGGDSDGL